MQGFDVPPIVVIASQGPSRAIHLPAPSFLNPSLQIHYFLVAVTKSAENVVIQFKFPAPVPDKTQFPDPSFL